MLRLLSIRNFVVVDALDLELAPGFSVLTGETGAGKSILLDALALLVGDRFETRQIKSGHDRAELAAEFDVAASPEIVEWADGQGFPADAGVLMLRRTLDTDGRSRAWINSRPATMGQLREAGERLVDLHGQHSHQTLLRADAQRSLVDAFGGFSALARETGDAHRAWQAAIEARDSAAKSEQVITAERDDVAARVRELTALAMTVEEWAQLNERQSRLSNVAALQDAAAAGEAALVDDDDALTRTLDALIVRLDLASAHDPALAEIVALIRPARTELIEAGRSLRAYRRKLEVDPRELLGVEERLRAIHDVARKYRTRPELLPELLRAAEERLAALAGSGDLATLNRRVDQSFASFRALADQLSAKRRLAARELGDRVTAAMQSLAMEGGCLEVVLTALARPAGTGAEQVELHVAAHRGQPPGPLARVASGGELSRIALAIEVVTSEMGSVPTLIFDEVDVGIGGAVASIVGELLTSLGRRRQVLCVTHLPQVAAFADTHFRVTKRGDAKSVQADVRRLGNAERVEELARMLAGVEITPKARAHARELLAQREQRT